MVARASADNGKIRHSARTSLPASDLNHEFDLNMTNLTPNPSFSVTIRLELPNRAGMLAIVTQAIAAVGGNLGHIDLIEHTRSSTIREITVNAYSSEHAEKIVQAVLCPRAETE